MLSSTTVEREMMDVGRAFPFVFEDPDELKKSLIGAALLIVPMFGWPVVGSYWMHIIRGAAYAGNNVPVPPLFVVGPEYRVRGLVEGGVLFSIVGLAFTYFAGFA